MNWLQMFAVGGTMAAILGWGLLVLMIKEYNASRLAALEEAADMNCKHCLGMTAFQAVPEFHGRDNDYQHFGYGAADGMVQCESSTIRMELRRLMESE